MQADLLQTQALALPIPSSPRSQGMHISTLIKNRAIRMGHLKGVPLEEISLVDASQQAWWDGLDQPSQLRMSIGLAWEDWYVPRLPGVLYHPGEMCIEGLFATHDGESLEMVKSGGESAEVAGHEIKTTSKSIKTVGDLSTQYMWLMQMKAYAKGLDCTLFYLHILYLYGDYSFPMQPRLHIWRIRFTPREIACAWDELVEEHNHIRGYLG